MNCNSLNGHPTEYGRRIKGIVCQGMLLINRDKWKRPIIIWERVMHLRVEYKAGTLCASWDNFTSSGYWACRQKLNVDKAEPAFCSHCSLLPTFLVSECLYIYIYKCTFERVFPFRYTKVGVSHPAWRWNEEWNNNNKRQPWQRLTHSLFRIRCLLKSISEKELYWRQ